jgi:hypothetical protein
MSLFRKGKNNQCKVDNIHDNSNQVALYMVIEKEIPYLGSFMAKYNLCVQKIYTDIDEAKIDMLVETRPTRLVIVETGLGKFLSTRKRKDIVDLIGVCDGVDKKVFVFYTNLLLKSDISKELGKRGVSIQWSKYRGTISMIKDILELNEDYLVCNIDENPPNVKEILGFKGYESMIQTIKNEQVFDLIEQYRESEPTEELPRFKISV